MVKRVDISKVDLNGCSQSVRREVEAMRDSYLEGGCESGVLHPQKKERDFFKHLILLKKVLLRKNNGSK